MHNDIQNYGKSVHDFYYRIGGNLTDKLYVDYRYLRNILSENNEKTFTKRRKYCCRCVLRYLKTFRWRNFTEFNFH